MWFHFIKQANALNIIVMIIGKVIGSCPVIAMRAHEQEEKWVGFRFLFDS